MQTLEQENEAIDALPATPDEQLENVIQLQSLQRWTKPDGRVRLPVSQVTTAANSPNFKLDVSHPFLDDIQFYIEKPDTWDDDSLLVQFFDEYGYEPSNMYELQTERVFVGRANDFDESLAITKAEYEDWYLMPRSLPEPSVRDRLVEHLPEIPTATVPKASLVFSGTATLITAMALTPATMTGVLSLTGLLFVAAVVAIVGAIVGFWTAIGIEAEVTANA